MITIMTASNTYNIWHLYNTFVANGNEIINFIDSGILDLREKSLFEKYWEIYKASAIKFYEAIKEETEAKEGESVIWDIDFPTRKIEYEFNTDQNDFEPNSFCLNSLNLKLSFKKRVKEILGI